MRPKASGIRARNDSPRAMHRSPPKILLSRWRHAKQRVLDVASKIKSAVWRRRYYVVYALVLAAVSALAVAQMQKTKMLKMSLNSSTQSLQLSQASVRNVTAKLNSSTQTLQLAQAAVQKLTPEELSLVQLTLSDAEVTTMLTSLAANPEKFDGLTALGLTRDLCKADRGLCTRGVLQRHLMPQINVSKLSNISTQLQTAGLGRVASGTRTISAASAVPLQKELLMQKVVGIAGAMLNGRLSATELPVVVADIAGEYFVVNGHHRWAGARIAGKNVTAHVIKAADGVSSKNLLNAIRKSQVGVTSAGL